MKPNSPELPIFYVYVHKRQTNGEPFYYGKGKGRRAWDRQRNVWYSRVVRKHGRIVEILKTGLTNEEAKAEERRRIAEARKRGENIVNQTDGGDEVGGEWSRRGALKTMELKIGIFSPGAASKGGKRGGETNFKNKTGVCGRSPEKMSEDGKKAGRSNAINKTGFCGRSPEKMSEDGKKGAAKTKHALRWVYQCSCGFTSNAGNVEKHQKLSGHTGKIKLT